MNASRPITAMLMALIVAIAPRAMQAQAKQSSGEVSSTRSASDAANARFSDLFNKGEAAEAAKVYAGDAIVMPPNSAPIKGETAIAEFWTGGWKAGIRN